MFKVFLIIIFLGYTSMVWGDSLYYTNEPRLNKQQITGEAEPSPYFSINISPYIFSSDYIRGIGVETSLIPKLTFNYLEVRTPLTFGISGYEAKYHIAEPCLKERRYTKNLDQDSDGDIDNDDLEILKDKLKRAQENYKQTKDEIVEQIDQTLDNITYQACKLSKSIEPITKYGGSFYREYSFEPKLKYKYLFVMPSVGYRKYDKIIGERVVSDGVVIKLSIGFEW